MYISYVGRLFLRMLKALILPLIIPSLVAAVGSLDMSLSGRVGGRAVAYYMSTTVLAVILGIILVTAIHPGMPAEKEDDIKTVSDDERDIPLTNAFQLLGRRISQRDRRRHSDGLGEEPSAA